MHLIAELYSKKRIAEHEKASKAVASRKPRPVVRTTSPEDFLFAWESTTKDTI
jgi:hypothetical protein